MNPDDPLEELLALERAGSEASDPLDELMASKAGQPSAYQQRIRKEQAAGILDDRIARENLNDREMAEAETPGYATQVFGGISSLIRDIPGAEAAQAGVRAALRGQSYDEAFRDIRGAEEDAPKWVRRYNRVAGSLPGVLALPGSAVRQGATYGALSGLTQADPDAGLGERAKDAAVGGTVGAAAGKAGELLGTGARAVVSRFRKGSPADIAIAREASTDAATRTNYGKAAEEAAAMGGTSPAITKALAAPDIAPMVTELRASRAFGSADDATILREVLRRLSEKQSPLISRIEAAVSGKPSLRGDVRELQMAKRELLDAAESPSTVVKPPLTMDVPASSVTVPATRLDVPAVSTAASPKPSLREALAKFEEQKHIARARTEGTPDQQNARALLERKSAERYQPRVSGESPGARSVEIAPEVSIATAPMRVQTAPEIIEQVPAAMPSLRAAVTAKARAESEREAFERAVDATRRIARGTKTPAKKLTKKSPEAFRASIKGMKPNEAGAAREGALAEYADDFGFSLNPFKGFGIPTAAGRANRVGPVIRELDNASLDNETIRALRAAGLPVSRANVTAGGLPALLRAAGLSVATP